MAKHELHIWFETDAENDSEELNIKGARLFHAALPGRGIEYEVVKPHDHLYYYCEWCMEEDRPRFDNSDDYTEHLREVHPDEAW